MSKFLTEILLSPYGEKSWLVESDIEYQSDIGGLITVPKHYATDLASVPKVFWNIFPPFGKHSGAAIVHDWCYGNHAYDRKTCDKIFLEAMTVLEVPVWKRSVMWCAVHLCGWMFY